MTDLPAGVAVPTGGVPVPGAGPLSPVPAGRPLGRRVLVATDGGRPIPAGTRLGVVHVAGGRPPYPLQTHPAAAAAGTWVSRVRYGSRWKVEWVGCRCLRWVQHSSQSNVCVNLY